MSPATMSTSPLCAVCSKIDFTATIEEFERVRLEREWGSWLHVDNLLSQNYQANENNGCSLCQLLSYLQYNNSSPQKKLMAVPLLDYLPYYSERFQTLATESLLLDIQEFGSPLDKNSRFPELIWRRAALVIKDDNPSGVLMPQVVPRKFDVGPVLSWITYCRDHHTTLCHPPTRNSVTSLRLIDCSTSSIKIALGDEQYVALSYVWGDNLSCDVRYEDGGQMLPHDLPNTVSDAVKVTEALGFKYLWIDKFCIDQNNTEIKHDQIRQMGAIYENAELTIIAAAGNDENYGLPGIGSRARTPQLVVEFDSFRIIEMLEDPLYTIPCSKWSTRGWTFQEGVLSRRRLVFTDDQVYFECNAMNCLENLQSSLDEVHVKDKTMMCSWIRSGIVGAMHSDPEDGVFDTHKLPICRAVNLYFNAIAEYSRRDLRNDDDSISAFQGIMQRFSDHSERPIHAIWGLPYPTSVCQEEKRHYFTQSLVWLHKPFEMKVVRRRAEFPSWTWVGWSGTVEWEVNREAEDISFSSAVRSMNLTDHNGNFFDLDACVGSTGHHKTTPWRILQFEARTVSLNLIFYRDNGSGRWFDFEIHNCRAFLLLSKDYGGSVNAMEFTHELQTDRGWRVIVTGTGGWYLYLLLLKQKPGDVNTYTREGVFRVYIDKGDPWWNNMDEDGVGEWTTFRVE